MKTLFKRILNNKWIVDIIVLSFLSAYVFIGINKAPFHGDEATLISMSRDYFYLFKEKNPEGLLYKKIWTPDQHVRIAAGSIEPFTIWLSLKIAGYNETHLSGMWVWNASDEGLDPKTNMWKWNVNNGNMPEKNVLFFARIPSTLFTILSIIIIYLITITITASHLSALISAIVFTTTPAILLNGRLAMQEGATLFFSACLIYAVIIILKQYQKNRFNWKSISVKYIQLAIIGGLAMASKHNTLLTIIPVYITLFIAPIFLMQNKQWKETIFILRHLLVLVIATCLSIVVFFVLMPIWWGFLWEAFLLLLIAAFLYTFCVYELGKWIQIVRGAFILTFVSISVFLSVSLTDIQWPLKTSIKYRQFLMEQQATSSPNALYTTKARVKKLIEELFFAKSEYYEASDWVVNKEMTEKIRKYENVHLDGRGGGLIWGFILITLTCIGVVALYYALWKTTPSEVVLLILWFGIPILLLLLTNTLPWQRYYLVLYSQMGIFVGIGLVFLKDNFKNISDKIISKNKLISNRTKK
jgi:hypothetical protein